MRGGGGGLMGHGMLPLEERPPGSAIDWRTVKRVLDFTKPHALLRNTIVVLTLIRSAQKPLLAWALAAIINGPITRGDFRDTLWESAGFALLALTSGIVFYFRQKLSLQLGESVVHNLRNAVFLHLQQMPMGYYHKTKLGRILSRMIGDIEAVRRGVQVVFFFSLLLLGQMIGAVALMLYYNWVMFCLLLAITPFVWLTNRHFHPRLSRASREVAESSSRLTGALAEAVRGIRVIQGYSRQRRGEEIYGNLVDRLAQLNVNLASESAAYLPLLDLNSQAFMAALLLLGGYGTLHGFAGMQLGSLIAFFFLPSLFFQSLQFLGNLYTQSITSMAGAERVFQLLDQKPEWTDAPDAIALPDPRNSAIPGTHSAVRVEFRHVHFAYDPGRPVLHDICFVAEPCQTIALVGHTGSGKTSIINLAAKFYLPTDGAVLVDGHDLRHVRGDSLRRQMGLVLQTNFLFTGTVLENIRFGKPEARDEEVHETVRQLHCHDLLENLPHGFATEVGEGGASLSLGQRQIVCFARALLADPRFLILDEATSSVDTVTESRLQSALARLLKGRTSFIIAHRLSTITRADQILVLDHGRIIERGTHRELLAQPGPYRSLYRQFALADERPPVAEIKRRREIDSAPLFSPANGLA